MKKIKIFNKNENFQLLNSVSSSLVFLEDKLNLKTKVKLLPDGFMFTCDTQSAWKGPCCLGIHLVFKLILSEKTVSVQLCEYNKIYKIVLFFIGLSWLCNEDLAFLGFILTALAVIGTIIQKNTIQKIFCAFEDNIFKESKTCSPKEFEMLANKLALSEICDFAEKIEKDIPNDSFELYKLAAAKKSTKACVTLGHFYYDGDVVARDLQKAFELWCTCEQNLDANSSLKLADMYRDGDVTEKDLKKAFQYYQKASKENFVQRIVEIYEQGTDLPEYLKAVASIYEERFDAGEKQILDKIIEIYTKLNDSENIQKWQIVKAKNGDIDLALSLGKKLYEEEKKESVELLEIAATKDDPVALRMLGEAYWNGDLVQEDDEKAIPLLQQAAQKGSLNAAEILVIHYDEYDEDDVKLLKALEQEIALFESGKYVDEDEDFSLADELYELAWLYCSGGEEGEIHRNVSKGIELFLKAIELGDTDSYLSLAEIYSEDEYGTVDYDKAIMYCEKAVEANVEDAENMLKNILKEQKMTIKKDESVTIGNSIIEKGNSKVWKAVGGAIIGGIIGGPAGAIAGAAIGTGTNKKNIETGKKIAKKMGNLLIDSAKRASDGIPTFGGIVKAGSSQYGIYWGQNKILTVLQKHWNEYSPGDVVIIPDFVFASGERHYYNAVNAEHQHYVLDQASRKKAFEMVQNNVHYKTRSDDFVAELCEIPHIKEIEKLGFFWRTVWINKS